MSAVMEVDASGVDRRIPANCVLATREGQWAGAEMRLYSFHARRTDVPPLRDVALIAWQTDAEIALRCGTIRAEAQMRPWDFSILRPGFESRWQWNTGFKATVLYLSGQKLARIAADAFDHDVDDVVIRESFQLQDRVIQHGIASLAAELVNDSIGGALYSDALVTQLCIHLLRHHAETRLREPRRIGALSSAQARRLTEFIDDNIGSELSLEALSAVTGMSQFHFARLFRKRFGTPPHAYVQQRRLARARKLVEQGDMALKEIVCTLGFYDQSHMTKLFRRFFDITPTDLRKRATRA